MSIPGNIEILAPWQSLGESGTKDRAEHLSAELQKELPCGHVLHGVRARAVAARIDRDDVLFEIDRATTPLALVHLTWKAETDPHWPNAKLLSSWQQWVQEEMLPAHAEYTPL